MRVQSFLVTVRVVVYDEYGLKGKGTPSQRLANIIEERLVIQGEHDQLVAEVIKVEEAI